MSTSCPSETLMVCITEYGPIDILGSIDRHRYLGRCFCGDLKIRGKSAVDHRLSCVWMKYKSFQHVFEDKQVSIELRFKLFGSIISSTLVYGLETTPLTLQLLERIDITQRTMCGKW